MISVLIECAKYEGNPLYRICQEMDWKISFSPHEIAELEKLLIILGPLERMFSTLDSETHSTIQRVYPSIQVKSIYL